MFSGSTSGPLPMAVSQVEARWNLGLREGISHRLALLPVGKPAHGRLEKEHAQDGKQDNKLKDDEPNQRFPPGHVPEPVPVQGHEKRYDSGAFAHNVVGFHKSSESPGIIQIKINWFKGPVRPGT